MWAAVLDLDQDRGGVRLRILMNSATDSGLKSATCSD